MAGTDVPDVAEGPVCALRQGKAYKNPLMFLPGKLQILPTIPQP